MSDHPAIARYARHINPAFVKLLGVLGYGRVLVRALDVHLWDDHDRRYVDLLAGFGSVNIGHNHPRLITALVEHLSSGAPGLVHTGPELEAAELGEALANRLPAPLSVSLLANSGGEAVDAAMKLARAATGRDGFVYCQGAYHGAMLGPLSVMGERRMRAPFEPLLANCRAVPFGDSGALHKALSRRSAAFIVEPILGEGGVVLPPPGYLREAQALCRRHGALFILDEVQTGLGRTGARFALDHDDGLVPDVVVLAKALGGGIAPIGAAITSPEVHQRAYGTMDRFDLHASTFAGNALACTAALETLRIVDDEELASRSRERGHQLLAGLRRSLADHPLVRHVRGRGLLVGIELGPRDATLLQRIAPRLVEGISRRAFGQWAALRLLEAGFVAQPTSHRWNVIKLEPPLTITAEQVDDAVDTIAGILNEYRQLPHLLKDVAARLGSQALGGWSFG